MNERSSILKIKIACVVVAFFAWIYVMSDSNPLDNRQINNVNVNISNLDTIVENNLAVSPGQMLQANVKIIGRRSEVSQSLKNGIELHMKIDDPKIGVNSAQVYIASPYEGVNYEIHPSVMEVNLEENVVKYEKVGIKTIGNLPSGYYVDSIDISANNVYISGPKSLTDKADKVQVQVELQGEKSDFIKWSKVLILDTNGNQINGLTVDKDKLAITAKLKKEKEVPISLTIEKNDLGVNKDSFTLDKSEVKIKGSPSTIDKIETISTQEVTMMQLRGSSSRDVTLIVPKGVQVDTGKVTINLKKSLPIDGLVQFDYSGQDVQLLKDDTSINAILEPISNIVVTFNTNSLSVSKNDITLYADLRHIPEDGYVNIEYKTTKNISDVLIYPSKIKVDKNFQDNEAQGEKITKPDKSDIEKDVNNDANTSLDTTEKTSDTDNK